MRHSRRSTSTKALTRLTLAAACLVALSAFVVALTVSDDKPDTENAAPQRATSPGQRLFVGEVVASEPVIPVRTMALRDMPPVKYPPPGSPIQEIPRRNRREEGWEPPTPAEEIWKIDPLTQLQRQTPTNKVFTTPDINVAGAGFTSVNPPDTVGDVGPNHYVQMINGGGTVVTIYNKTGGLILSTSMAGIGGCSTGGGDPVVLYDDQADRWLLSEFGSGNSLCVQISQTPDPTGTYYSYSFPTPSFPDYPKYGVWPSATDSAYFVGSNEAQSAAYALDRASMLTGAPATSQRFTMPDLAGFGFQMALPAHADGPTPPPIGRNNVFMRHRDDEVHNAGSNNSTEDYLEMWEFNIDWATPGNSSLTQLPDIPVAEFSSELCGLVSFNCVPQPGTVVLLDPLREVIMQTLQYRNYGSHESILGTFVVDVGDFVDHHAMRWFELRATGGGAWSLYQEGTYSPDADHRWMGSIAQDQNGDIALGYSVSSGATSPSMRYTGRLVGDPLGVMTQAETTIIAGSGNNASNRWGDYSAMHVDPVDNCTFWHTNMYTDGSGVWNTRVAAFNFDACGENVIILGDDSYVEVPLPFTFPFCGVDYNSVFVNSNGNLTFGGGDTDFTESVGELLSQEPRIAPFWDDLRPPSGGTVFWSQVGPDILITYENIPEYFSTGANTATVTLRPDGTHQIAYGALSMLDGIAGRSPGGNIQPDPGETDLSAAAQPLGMNTQVVYEQFTASDNDLAGLTLEFAACPVPCEITCALPVEVSNDLGACSAIVNYSAPSTSGDCGTVTCSPASGSVFPVGATNVSCTTTAGPSCSFEVQVVDDEQPMLPGVPVDQTVECDAVPPPASVTATDNCPGVTMSFDETSTQTSDGSCSDVNYTISRTWTATDASGSTNTATQIVTVRDTTPPTVVMTQPNHDETGLPSVNTPISVAFTSDDNCSEETHDVLKLSGCVILDGNTYGDRDGQLSDEGIQINKYTLCQAMARCGFNVLYYPRIDAESTDPCGNTGSDGRIIRRRLLKSEVCGRP